MKNFLITLLAGASLLAAPSQAYVVMLYKGDGCTGESWRRNIYDNTCGYTAGFKSMKLVVNGGRGQQLTAWSRNACAGPVNRRACVAGPEAGPETLKLGTCYSAKNRDGGSNALSSYFNVFACPR